MALVMPAELPPVPLRKQLKVYAASLRPAPRRPFLLYGQGRLGSTLLGSLLESHPQVRFGDELLQAPVRRPARWLEGQRSLQRDHSFGVHVKPYHLKDFQRVSDPSSWLRQRHEAGWLLLHLQRRNTLLHVLSNATLQTLPGAHFRQGDGQQVGQVVVPPDVLLHWMGRRQESLEEEAAALAGLPHLTVVYEDDLLPGPRAWAQLAGTVFAELGLPPHAVSTELRKINPPRLESFVANADEVRTAIASSRWAGCLDEA